MFCTYTSSFHGRCHSMRTEASASLPAVAVAQVRLAQGGRIPSGVNDGAGGHGRRMGPEQAVGWLISGAALGWQRLAEGMFHKYKCVAACQASTMQRAARILSWGMQAARSVVACPPGSNLLCSAPYCMHACTQHTWGERGGGGAGAQVQGLRREGASKLGTMHPPSHMARSWCQCGAQIQRRAPRAGARRRASAVVQVPCRQGRGGGALE